MPKNPLTPRQTALRLLEHMEADAGYDDIIRQVRILQDIDQTMSDADVVGSQSETSVEQARTITQGKRGVARDERPRPAKHVEKPRPAKHGSWKSLADRSEDVLDSLLRRAVWIQ